MYCFNEILPSWSFRRHEQDELGLRRPIDKTFYEKKTKKIFPEGNQTKFPG
jgi:hypothetical protein